MSALKFLLIAVSIAAANAGLALTSTSDNTYRSLGNLAQVSTQSKTIETPYSSSSKSDIRVSNPSVYASPAPIGHYQPAVQHYSSAPVLQHYSQVQVPHGGQVYAAAHGPVVAKTAYAIPAPQTVQYAHQPQVAYAHQAPVSYVQPAQVAYAHQAPAVSYSPAVHQPHVGIAYSPANAVAHLTYSNVNDHVNYAW